MGTKIVNRIVLVTGLISLLHAAFSAAHHRTYMRLTEQDWTQLPVDIVVQTVVSLLVVVYNVIQVVGNFKEIRATVDMQEKSWDTLGNLPSFYTFNHRGMALYQNYEQEESSSAGSKSSLDVEY
ncbi:membrane magnesium transporter 1-like [Rhagoletis pomonella]|uniref:membrane magnesium transporter 1-like n=1 Tax=Rhagoletis pomonella TaxID=28610 RepID=UPI00177BC1BE|nr:membrane magnesium transporter 1-like [Rhagoletis pomonella]